MQKLATFVVLVALLATPLFAAGEVATSPAFAPTPVQLVIIILPDGRQAVPVATATTATVTEAVTAPVAVNEQVRCLSLRTGSPEVKVDLGQESSWWGTWFQAVGGNGTYSWVGNDPGWWPTHQIRGDSSVIVVNWRTTGKKLLVVSATVDGRTEYGVCSVTVTAKGLFGDQ